MNENCFSLLVYQLSYNDDWRAANDKTLMSHEKWETETQIERMIFDNEQAKSIVSITMKSMMKIFDD